jgi:hypothetical protein
MPEKVAQEAFMGYPAALGSREERRAVEGPCGGVFDLQMGGGRRTAPACCA